MREGIGLTGMAGVYRLCLSVAAKPPGLSMVSFATLPSYQGELYRNEFC